MICPVCKTAMVIIEHQDIELDYCTKCRGVWFDAGELELLLEAGGLREAAPYLEAMTAREDARTREKKRKCPICLRKMKKVPVEQGSDVLVDICQDGDGIWFDHHEVEHLATAIAGKTGDAAAAKLVRDYFNEVFKF